MPSPFEQNHKHCTVLKAACDDGAVELPKRLGFSIKPDIRSMVLVSKNARITRPKAKIKGLDEILKVDQIKAKIDKAFDGENNPLVMVKIIASDTLEDFARRLAALHIPASFDWHAKFGLQREAVAPQKPVHVAREATPEPALAEPVAVPETVVEEGKKSKLACSSCGTVVAYNIAKFCWFNKPRFGGKVFCFECQKSIPNP